MRVQRFTAALLKHQRRAESSPLGDKSKVAGDCSRHDVDSNLAAALRAELNRAGFESEQRVVAAAADACARVEMRARAGGR